jgi:hypothetical protein
MAALPYSTFSGSRKVYFVGFEVLTVETVESTVIRVVMPGSMERA